MREKQTQTTSLCTLTVGKELLQFNSVLEAVHKTLTADE
jgi:hypothetical protein